MTGTSRYLPAAFLALLLSTGASGFDIDGFKSGMTREQLTAYANARGLEAREMAGGGWMIGKPAEYRFDGTFSFCGQGMSSYSRGFEFDVDYVPTLNLLMAQFGQPRRVETQRQPWTGTGGGDILSVSLIFLKENEKAELSFTPQGRDAQGQLRFNRVAAVSYTTRSPCTKVW